MYIPDKKRREQIVDASIGKKGGGDLMPFFPYQKIDRWAQVSRQTTINKDEE